ncbi:hypothetical protein JG688_00001978 [Phytophthora aleatoria]|uniref:Uncharacterized protein n=1 Tax=Phytophthora aleatoria TaxID=2496075 RepID=A0A8J5IX45_9STRA|nr:hypothetical protein JG688_00001978 [Phytophthora aleatoria]
MLETTIESLLERVGLAHTEYPTATTTVSSVNGENVYYYEGKFHLLPQTFEFPRTGPFGAWMLWWFGDKSRGYPPLKKIRTIDLPTSCMSKRYSDWAMMIQHLCELITESGEHIPSDMTEQDAIRLFNIAMDSLQLPPSKRQRRLSELSLTTILRLVREVKAKRQRLNKHSQ